MGVATQTIKQLKKLTKEAKDFPWNAGNIIDKAYTLGTLNGLDKAEQEIYKVETLRHADEVHCSCLVILRDNLSKINEEARKLK